MDVRRGTVAFVGLGVVAEAVYLAACLRLPWWRYGDHLYSWSGILGRDIGTMAVALAAGALLMGVYLLGWRVLRAGEVSRRTVWVFVLLFAVTLFWLLPITSDLYHYLGQAYTLTDLGGNPLQEAPLAVAHDPLLLAFPADYFFSPSAYGPAWLILSAPGTLARHDLVAGIFYLKGLATAAYLLCAWLVEKLVGELRPGDAIEALYLFAWNPLVAWMAVGDGHNDVVMMAAVLLALWFLLRTRWAVAFGTLAISVWIKYVGVVLVPLALLHAWRRVRRPQALAVWGATAAVVSILFLLPLDAVETLPAIARRFFHPENWTGSAGAAATWGLVLGSMLYAGAYLFLVRRLATGAPSFARLGDTAFLAFLLAFLLGAVRAQPWHLIWPAALAGLSQRRWAWPVVAGLSGLMLVTQIWIEWGMPAPGGGT
ncbi:MAG: hypothetical protein PVG11_01935 [Anaerolineae bacterium]